MMPMVNRSSKKHHQEKGTINGTASDLDAKFSLEVSPGAVLEISYIGYQTQEVKVGDRTSLSVTLAENQQILGMRW